MINDIYEIGLEKFAGDTQKAEEFTKAFLKEAFEISKEMIKEARKNEHETRDPGHIILNDIYSTAGAAAAGGGLVGGLGGAMTGGKGKRLVNALKLGVESAKEGGKFGAKWGGFVGGAKALKRYNDMHDKKASASEDSTEDSEDLTKEAAGPETISQAFKLGLSGSAGKALGLAAAGLGIYGVSSAMSQASQENLRVKFQQSLDAARSKNPILSNADHVKVQSYANTVFKFAPHVATDPNLLTAILTNAIHGDGIDPMTIRTLADLESRYIDSKRNALFSPKGFA